MHPELRTCLKSLNRCIYFVTDEEDRAIQMIHEDLSRGTKGNAKIFVYSQPFGMVESRALLDMWKNKTNADDTMSPVQVFNKIYTDDPHDHRHFYIITDPERWLADVNCNRRILNIIHQLRSDMRIIKCLIFVSSTLKIPPRLQNYIQVIRDDKLNEEEILTVLAGLNKEMGREIPPGAASWFKGLTTFGIEAAVAQSVVKTKSDPKNPKRIDKKHIFDYKKNQVNGTDLLSLIDVSQDSFAYVGGVENFKKWVEDTKSAWTAEGRKYGLKPPKGVLLAGVWGCGKSLSVKATGNAWGLPVVQLELGKLRSSGVGDTEANVYSITKYLEAMAPCIAWVDEAEKSMSGSGSSNFSDAGTTSRTLGILSTWHQETNAEVCLMMTANSLTTLPIEFTNRMEDRFFFDLPADDDARIAILKIHLKKETPLTDDEIAKFPLLELAKAAEDLVPREMAQAVRAALRTSFSRDKEGLDPAILKEELKTKSRILQTMSKELKETLDWVGMDPDTKEGIRARFASPRKSKNTLTILAGGKSD